MNLQVAGAMAFLSVVSMLNGHHLFPLARTPLLLPLLASFVLPLIVLLVRPPASQDFLGYAIKYLAFYFLILLGDRLPLSPLFRARYRLWAFGTVLAILLCGTVIGRTFSLGETERVQGIFANPNNQALAAMSLFFFSDRSRDPLWALWALHGLVLTLIVLSGTAGALLGYGAGVLYLLGQRSWGNRWAQFRHTPNAPRIVLSVLGGLLVGVAMLVGQREPVMETRIITAMGDKIQLAYENLPLVSSDTEINYWKLGQENGLETTSALWRLMRWRETLSILAGGGLPAISGGYGLGSSEALVGGLPHNDYLRILFELGVLGALANGWVWLVLIRRLRPSCRWIVVMLAVYGFTENNLDNFLVMSLFVLFVVSARVPAPPRTGASPCMSAT